MNKYEKGKIYQISDVGYTKTYYGSTCETLSRRMSRHKEKYRAFKADKMDCNRRVNTLFEEFGIDSCKIELVENYPCNSREELLRREGYYIKNNECVNKIVSGRTNREWKEDNYEQYMEKKKEYWEKNKVYFSNQKREFAKLNPEIIKQRSQRNYEKFKTKLLEQHLCVCGVCYTYCHKKRHENTQKHQNWLKQQQQAEQEQEETEKTQTE